MNFIKIHLICRNYGNITFIEILSSIEETLTLHTTVNFEKILHLIVD